MRIKHYRVGASNHSEIIDYFLCKENNLRDERQIKR